MNVFNCRHENALKHLYICSGDFRNEHVICSTTYINVSITDNIHIVKQNTRKHAFKDVYLFFEKW